MLGRKYRIGEVSRMLNLKSYVLRFWETEFPQLDPHRTEKGQRMYSVQDIDLLKSIKELLHEKGMTIEGARKHLEHAAAEAKKNACDECPPAEAAPAQLNSIVDELESIRAMLVSKH